MCTYIEAVTRVALRPWYESLLSEVSGIYDCFLTYIMYCFLLVQKTTNWILPHTPCALWVSIILTAVILLMIVIDVKCFHYYEYYLSPRNTHDSHRST